MGKIKRSFTMGGGKATLACLILIVTVLALTGCEQPTAEPTVLDITGETVLEADGSTIQLKAYSNGQEVAVTWSSSDESLAVVSTEGVVTASDNIGEYGSVTITATSSSGVKGSIDIFVVPSGGYEEKDGTYYIYTAEGLLAWNAYVTNTKNYVPFTDDYGYSYYVVKTNAKLMADISLEGKSWTPVGYYDYDAWKEYYYAGTFDGKGHTISNLYIDSSYNNDAGLFGDIASSGEVKNLILKDVNISVNVDGDYYYVGGIAGYNEGTIENCSVSGTVLGEINVGGIVGYNYGTIENCSVSGTVESQSEDVGGIAGYNEGTIKNCSVVSGTIEGQQFVGGIAGYNGGGAIENCNVSGTVNGSDWYVGGIAGINDSGTITACYNTGNVSGTSSVGGVVGDNSWGTITACYNTGNVSGTSSVGGVVGDNSWGTITACYNTGDIESSSDDYVGGVVGSNSATVNTCYWSVSDEHTTISGIGNDTTSETVEKVGENDVTWKTAMDEMNTVLSGYGYEYTKNTDSTTNDTMPLIIDTVESSN